VLRPSAAAILEKAYPQAKSGGSAPSSADKAKVSAILGNSKLPAVAEKGMAYVVHWADGRGVFAVRRKADLTRWLRKTGTMAEIVSIKYGKAEFKGKRLRVESEGQDKPMLITEDQPPNLPSDEDTEAGKCPECGCGLMRTRGIGYSHACNSWGSHRVVAVKGGKNVLWDGTKDHWAKANKTKTNEVITEAFAPILEAAFTAQDMDLDKTYGVFKASYEKQTGKAWAKDKFLERIGGWTLYGEQDGFVATRQQASGPIKLVGAAGNPIGVKKGFQEVLGLGKPVWGAMDLRLATLAARMGMKMPPAWVMVKIMNAIKDRFAQASGVSPEALAINQDGSITIDYPDVGKATKFLVGNKEYFQWLLKTQGDQIPAVIRTAVSYFLTTGKPPPLPKDHDENAVI